LKFILIFGPQAVGKMTVGQELAKQTDLKLFHNHMTIELVSNFFSYGTATGKRLVKLFRQEIFEAVAKSELPGLIFTFTWAFDMKEDWDYVAEVCELFESHGAEIYFVELEADLVTRLERNRTPNRLEHKPTKRNFAWSDQDILNSTKKYRLNSNLGEIKRDHYLRINNTRIGASEAAKKIKDEFQL